MGIIHRDIKPENLTFGNHIDMDEGFSYLNSSGKDIYSEIILINIKEENLVSNLLISVYLLIFG